MSIRVHWWIRISETPIGEFLKYKHDAISLDRLRRETKPLRLHWFTRLRSTNDHAAAMRARGELFGPAIVLTGHQTAGRGRGSNVWWSGPGSLTVTFVMPIDPSRLAHQIPLIAGLAVRNAAAQISGVDAIKLKWPNDLMFDGRKLAGLLCERVQNIDLIGLGLNVNLDKNVPRGLRDRVVFLSEIAGKRIDRTDALIAIAKHLHPMLARPDEHSFSNLLREYDSHHWLIGRRVSITTSGDDSAVSGRCEGLDSIGRLLVRERGQLHRIVAGQVNVL